jgi:hypothetical protein
MISKGTFSTYKANAKETQETSKLKKIPSMHFSVKKCVFLQTLHQVLFFLVTPVNLE